MRKPRSLIKEIYHRLNQAWGILIGRPSNEVIRKFTVLMDFKNIYDNIDTGNPDVLSNYLDKIIQSVSEKGEIIFAAVFVPEHLLRQAPILMLRHEHRFELHFSPRQIEGVITKDADTVDADMSEYGRKLLEFCPEITDLVVFSGDADFSELIAYARWRRKKVTVFSPKDATAGRYISWHTKKKITLNRMELG